ncbi:hypothetical protein GGR33_000781 [Methylobacterium brachythecii]|uniref:Uncharacterized protein n=1 Tax=Methylobacterium brachythecii TaxID=1176177 RepID=A0A7W6AFI4_9HYPH|nr:hypothetical protein [Methylobacterium brachythecii]MBB3901301.1 hypothetical protein [Methylobacterium brachythecii]
MHHHVVIGAIPRFAITAGSAAPAITPSCAIVSSAEPDAVGKALLALRSAASLDYVCNASSVDLVQ